MHAVCLSKDGAPLVLCLLGVPRVYCALSRLPNSAHNVPSAWNTLSPLLLLANAYSLIRAELKYIASWKTSPGAPPPPRPQPPATHAFGLSTHSASLTIKAGCVWGAISMVLGTYCVPTLLYRIIWLKTSTSLCYAAVSQGKHRFRSTCCELLPPVEQRRCVVIYHVSVYIPTEGTYYIFTFLQYPEQTWNRQQEEQQQRANNNTAQNTSYTVFTALPRHKTGQ